MVSKKIINNENLININLSFKEQYLLTRKNIRSIYKGQNIFKGEFLNMPTEKGGAIGKPWLNVNKM